MSKKRFKHKKLPFCVKVLDNDLGEQFKKNSDRGYYEDEPFDVADWGDDK